MNKKTANAIRTKGLPLFNEVGELVEDSCATGKHAFRSGRPTPAPPTQNVVASEEPALFIRTSH